MAAKIIGIRTLGYLLPIAICLWTLPALGGVSPARVAPVTEEHFGDKIVDPYRWMEKTDPKFVAWARAQDARTRTELKALPGYDKLSRQVTAAVEAEVRISNAQRVGDLIYYEKQGRGEAQASLYARPLAGGEEKRLIDPVAIGGPTTAINEYAPSPDNRFLAYSLAQGGSEEAVLYFTDLRAGRDLPEAIDRARFAGPQWSPDGATVFYTRMKVGNATGADRFADQTAFRHKPGDDPAHDVAVFSATAVGSALGREGYIQIAMPPASDFAFAAVNSGVSPESEWYAAPASDLGVTPRWRRIATLADKIDQPPVVHGHEAWLATFKDAPRRKVVRIDLDHPDMANSTVVVPERAAVLRHIAGARDGVYLVYASGGAFSLRRVGFDGGTADIATPYEATIADLATDPRRDGAVVSLESRIRPVNYFETSAAGLRTLSLAPPFPIDLSALVSETIEATAKNGVKIPVSVIRRRDLKRDGAAPALIEAYGAYGVSEDPGFRSPFIPFLLRGGVWAVAHVRGGGEFGETWHLAGKGANKPNTWRDFIASVQALEAAGYISPAKVAGFGVSAGGITIGRTVTERPDLLAAAVMWAPSVNMLHFETTEGGPANVAEFGSVSTKEGYAALKEMDAYSHVVDGTKYPAVLITGGMNDHRVPVWQAAEMAARLQRATSSGKPVRLRIDFQSGHHVMGAAEADVISQVVDTLAFILEATGDPEFQPH